MNTKLKSRVVALALSAITALSMLPTPASAAQVNSYHDPAEHWLTANNRTNELDANAGVTHETFYCAVCKQGTTFTVFRTPEYTRDGASALSRNVKYSDGTMLGGTGTGTILDGTPGVDAFYTGYHWTKACGTMNTNMGLTDYGCGKNVYWLYDCAAEFMEDLDETVTYEAADDVYHTKTTTGGEYCCFCYGTRHTDSSTLERHNMATQIIPQIGNQRFAIVEHCTDCDYTKTAFVGAKSVVRRSRRPAPYPDRLRSVRGRCLHANPLWSDRRWMHADQCAELHGGRPVCSLLRDCLHLPEHYHDRERRCLCLAPR